MPSKKTSFGGGNLGAQKYNARRNVELFQQALANAQPSKATSSWRNGPPKLYKRIDGRKILQEKYRYLENAELSKKIYDIHHEPRQKATREYAPGWRIGNISGGMCIDCYRTENPLVRVYHKLHNYKEKRKAYDKKIAADDAALRKNISQLTSDLAPAVHRKEYEYNRYRARFFFNKKDTATVLHLGLSKKKKDVKDRPASAKATTTTTTTTGGRRSLDQVAGGDLQVNYYSGANPTKEVPRPSSAGIYRGSNLCYSMPPSRRPCLSSPPGTGAFDAKDAQLLVAANGEVLGRMDDDIANDTMILQSVKHLRPQSANSPPKRAVQTQPLPSLRDSRPSTAPTRRGDGNGEKRPLQESNALDAEEVYLGAQMNALHRMFPAPYSEQDLELFAGALAAEVEKEKQETEIGISSQRLEQIARWKEEPENASKAYDRQQLGRAGMHLKQKRSIEILKPPRKGMPVSMQQREKWSSSPPKRAQRDANERIYDQMLTQSRLSGDQKGASTEGALTDPQIKEDDVEEGEEGEDDDVEPKDHDQPSDAPPIFSLASAGLTAFSSVGTRRSMLDRQKYSKPIPTPSRLNTALSCTEHLGQPAQIEQRVAETPVLRSPPRFPQLSAKLSKPAFPVVESNRNIPYSKYSDLYEKVDHNNTSDDAHGINKEAHKNGNTLEVLANTAGVSINSAALSRRSSLSAKATKAERQSELQLLQQTMEKLQRKKDLQARQQQKHIGRAERKQKQLKLHVNVETEPNGIDGSALTLVENTSDTASPKSLVEQNTTAACERRKRCMLTTSLALPNGQEAHVVISDVGMTWVPVGPDGFAQPDHASVPSSSGLLVEVRAPPLTAEVFVSVAQLRNLSCASDELLTLRSELACLVALDKNAGLYQALSDRLSSDSETQLLDLVVKALSMQLTDDSLSLRFRTNEEIWDMMT